MKDEEVRVCVAQREPGPTRATYWERFAGVLLAPTVEHDDGSPVMEIDKAWAVWKTLQGLAARNAEVSLANLRAGAETDAPMRDLLRVEVNGEVVCRVRLVP